MKVKFNVNYRTNWGEAIYISGSVPALGEFDDTKAVKMNLHGSEQWIAEFDIPDHERDFKYCYLVKRDDGTVIRREWGQAHALPATQAEACLVHDRWQDQPWDKPYYSSAFTDCIGHRTIRDAAMQMEQGKITVQVAAPMVSPEHVVAISGESKVLGNWVPSKVVRMSDALYPIWTATIDACDDLEPGSEFKFVIIEKASGKIVSWEGGSNRRFDIAPVKDAATLAAGMRFINTQTPWRGAGVAIPVFSLRSEKDFGVGDFYDLIPLIDWAAATGQNFVQILPINDTTMTGTWIDSYPYNANSTFALHPQYLRLSEMGALHDAERRHHYDNLAKELNTLKVIDYERVNNAKRAYAMELFQQEGSAVVESEDFKNFVRRNSNWLTPYAAYCVLRDRNHTAEFDKWGEYATYDAAKITDFVAHNTSYINFEYYLQYNLDKQMRHVRDYAHAHGVAIKGDIPIGISRTSVDAWMYPHLFFLDSQAGAPPDDFSVLGQNWGFPTYNWEVMSRDNFAWWKARFSKMSEYFDAYRIDHVLGFFRIWEIPMDAVHGLLGHFNPSLSFSADELRDSYDFWIDVDLYTTPYIMDYFLSDFFGEYTEEACDHFLVSLGYGRYKLKPEFDTQRKVADYFDKLEKDDKNTRLCNALMGLIDNVLFIKDREHEGMYFPRVSAQFTYIYRSLTDYERWCFDRLYNDYFYHRNNDFWYGKAMWKLPPLIDSTDMLTCAEDLGMIPDCVPAVMKALEILTLEIQRMPKDPRTSFGDTWHYPYYSVCTTSTHDMSGIRGWWEEDRQKTQQFYNQVLHEGGEAPFYAEPWICEKIVRMHLQSPSMLCILPLQDWLSINGELRRQNPQEEQINVPANSRHYWRYRMHITLENLLSQNAYNTMITDMIKNSGR